MQRSLGHKYPFLHTKTHGPFIADEDARRGVLSGRVAVVLISSLALATMAGTMIAALHLFPV